MMDDVSALFLPLSLCLPCYFNYKYYGAVNRTRSVTIFGSLVTVVYIVVDILKDYVGVCIVSIYV